MKKESFYEAGLKFSCKRCSACCRYEAGFVFLSETDIDNLVKALKIDKNSVLNTYCRTVTDWEGAKVLSLKEKSNNDCILWDEGCTVYDFRPLQCTAYPFWESILASKEAWQTAASACPGINSGRLFTKDVISGFLKARAREPVMSGLTEV